MVFWCRVLLPTIQGEVTGSVAGAVVGHDPMDVIDAMGGEPELRTCKERCSGGAPLICQWFCVGQSREPIDDGVKVHIATIGPG